MACGTGIVTRQLRAHLKPTVALTATDINPGMLDYAQRKLKNLKEIEWRQADIADLPFLDASFNVVACQFGLMFVQHKDRAFREMRRREIFPENPPQFFKAPCSFYDVDVLHSLLTVSGFDQINIRAVQKECHSNTAKSLAIGLIEGAPVLAEIQERGGSSEPIVDAVATTLARTGGDNPYRSTMQAIVVTAQAKDD